MPVSLSPWWCGPDDTPGATCVSPIQIARLPTVSPDRAAMRDMPDVCAVAGVRASAGTWWSLSTAATILPSRMADRARRWGVVPEYFAFRGDRVVASPKAQDAVLASLGATRARPPRMKRYAVPDDACAQAPDRAWGWAIQLYALRSRDSWGVGDFGDLRRFARWARRRGASLILINPLGAQVPSLPYEPSPSTPRPGASWKQATLASPRIPARNHARPISS